MQQEVPTEMGMWQRFTRRAQYALHWCQAEAEKRNTGFVGSVDLLLGLLLEEQRMGTQFLAQCGITYDRVRDELPHNNQSQTPAISLRVTPAAKRVLELAVEEAARLKHKYVGNEHIFLALIREQGYAAKLLQRMGVNLQDTRVQVEAYLGPVDDASPPTSP